MTDATFRVPGLFDYVATLAWAMSGAVVGIRKQFDLTGVFVVALLSATGGGLMRDAIFLQRTPILLANPIYLPLIAATTLVMALFTGPLTRLFKYETVTKLIDLIDALGTPAFAVIGMQLAEDRNIPLVGVLFIGVVNGCAGGLLRDVFVRDVPSLLRPGQFVSLTLTTRLRPVHRADATARHESHRGGLDHGRYLLSPSRRRGPLQLADATRRRAGARRAAGLTGDRILPPVHG